MPAISMYSGIKQKIIIYILTRLVIKLKKFQTRLLVAGVFNAIIEIYGMWCNVFPIIL
jgi:hypothetical protein